MGNRLDWFQEARYGMFVTWGPYSVNGRGEWVANRERIPFAEYRSKFAEPFKAERYDPDDWARLAVAAGMKYIVLTTRHHDGFCLWDTDTTEFNAARIGPRRDLLGPYVEACRRHDLRVGFYYSVADWFHSDYPDAYARDWPEAWPDESARRRFVNFYIAQLRELMTRYGQIDMLWYDGCIPMPLDGDTANSIVRSLQPDILINNRNGQADFVCSEQAIVPPKDPSIAWEACMTLNNSWGYHAGDNNWKTPRQVVRMIADCAKSAGNLLLNVGPRSDGTIPEASHEILTAAGRWLARNRAFLPRSERSPFSWSMFGAVTVKDNIVYLHLFQVPGDTFCYAEIRNRVTAVRRVDTGSSIPFEQASDGRLFLSGLDGAVMDDDFIAVTLAIEVAGKPEPLVPQTSFWIPGVDV